MLADREFDHKPGSSLAIDPVGDSDPPAVEANVFSNEGQAEAKPGRVRSVAGGGVHPTEPFERSVLDPRRSTPGPASSTTICTMSPTDFEGHAGRPVTVLVGVLDQIAS